MKKYITVKAYDGENKREAYGKVGKLMAYGRFEVNKIVDRLEVKELTGVVLDDTVNDPFAFDDLVSERNWGLCCSVKEIDEDMIAIREILDKKIMSLQKRIDDINDGFLKMVGGGEK